MKIPTLDLFCGAGGSSWGARKAGADIVAAFDLWPMAGKAHDLNFPKSKFIGGRLEDCDTELLAKQFPKINLIIASPECTNHSPAKGNKPRCDISKGTAFQVVRFADTFKPRWLVIENVVNMRKWDRYSEFRDDLEKLGYNLQEQVLNAAEFGVPQARQRLFLTADLQQMPNKIIVPKKPVRNASEIVDFAGDYKWTPLRSPKRSQATLARAERAIAALGTKKPFLLVYYGTDGSGGWQRLDRPLRTITTIDRFAIVRPDKEDGHMMRMLQVSELQAAMGMPLAMNLNVGTRRERVKMIGNAVCPPVMEQVVRSLTRG